jgi:hypothetical protein
MKKILNYQIFLNHLMILKNLYQIKKLKKRMQNLKLNMLLY